MQAAESPAPHMEVGGAFVLSGLCAVGRDGFSAAGPVANLSAVCAGQVAVVVTADRGCFTCTPGKVSQGVRTRIRVRTCPGCARS